MGQSEDGSSFHCHLCCVMIKSHNSHWQGFDQEMVPVTIKGDVLGYWRH